MTTEIRYYLPVEVERTYSRSKLIPKLAVRSRYRAASYHCEVAYYLGASANERRHAELWYVEGIMRHVARVPRA